MITVNRCLVLSLILIPALIGLGLRIFQDRTHMDRLPQLNREVMRIDDDREEESSIINEDREEASPIPSNEEDDSANQTSRDKFARAMAMVKKGMTEKEVLDLLGKPDDFLTQNDRSGISTARTKEIWNYGSNGHLTFATLGAVYIDEDHKVQYIFGGRGKPPSPQMFSEEELRSLLRQIDKTPGYNASYHFNPLPLIQTVNRLQPFGKEKALAAIDEFLRVASGFHDEATEGVFLVLRVLFDVPDDPGYMPHMRVGAPWPAAPEDAKRLPRFPILLQDDVPLLLVSGYDLAGLAEMPERHVNYFRENGRLREKPLMPGNNPLGVMDSWAKNASCLFEGPGRLSRNDGAAQGKELIANQLLNLLDSVYRKDADVYGRKLSCRGADEADREWSTIKAEIAKLKIKWDAKKNCYTFEDGSRLPKPIRKLCRRHIWKLEGLEGKAELILERKDKDHLQVQLKWSGKRNQKKPEFVLEVLEVTKIDKPLAKFGSVSISSWAGDEVFSSQSFLVDLLDGADVQARLKIEERERLSPVFKP